MNGMIDADRRVDDEDGNFARAVELYEAAEVAEDAGNFEGAESARRRARIALSLLAAYTGENPERLKLKAQHDALQRYLESC